MADEAGLETLYESKRVAALRIQRRVRLYLEAKRERRKLCGAPALP
jgi:hypothetical protein